MIPELDSLEAVLGTVRVSVNDRLVKKMIEAMSSLQCLLSLVEKSKQHTPFPFLPTKVAVVAAVPLFMYESADRGCGE